jgi:hypothetical protein
VRPILKDNIKMDLDVSCGLDVPFTDSVPISETDDSSVFVWREGTPLNHKNLVRLDVPDQIQRGHLQEMSRLRRDRSVHQNDCGTINYNNSEKH